MKPYGRNKKLSHNLVDNHPQKGWVNWWERTFCDIDKKRERQEWKREIRIAGDRYS